MTALPLRVDAVVRGNAAEGGAGFRLALEVAGGGWTAWEPGQFVMLSPGAIGAAPRHDPLLPRPMAIYREREGALEILYKVSGRGTQLLAEARPGARVRMVGPLGTPFALPEPGATAILVGGGTGIASLYELAAQARTRGPVAVLLGARRASDLLGAGDFAALGVDLRVATEDGSRGERGLVTALLERALDAASGSPVVYACGPTPMMRRCAEIAAARGVACVVSLENRMACGFGVCLGCAVPRADGTIALVCRDGPIFDAAAVGWAGVP
jgi:dihydroorotate dehydrogenase electron transfer subunit